MKKACRKWFWPLTSRATSNRNDVWIFPVPASADKIKMDIVSNIPSLAGQNLSDSVSANLYYVKKDIESTQVYPLVYRIISRIITLNSNQSSDELGLGAVDNGTSANPVPDVIVQSHLEKGGMVSEIISAKTADGLAKYFKDKGLNFDNKLLQLQQLGLPFGFRSSVKWWQDYLTNNFAQPYAPKHPRGSNCHEKRNFRLLHCQNHEMQGRS